jgi:rnfC: electron transport complex, RnfABCDGE type, C subunit
MTFEELQKIVYDAGIVGAGGAGFPTHRKFSDKVKQIIVNAAECEPLMMISAGMSYNSSAILLYRIISICLLYISM